MRIYYFCYEGFKKIGKINNHIRETVSWFSKFDNEVHFFNPNIIKPEFDAPVKLHLVPIINIPIIKWLSFDIFAFFSLLFNTIIHRPTVIYYRESSSLVPLIISKLLSVPLFIEVNGWVLAELEEYGYSKFKLMLFRLFQELNYRNATLLIPVSEGLKILIIKHYRIPSEKIIAVNNGTNPEKYKPIPVGYARKTTGLNKDDQIIGFIGGCYPHHGVQHLINAAPYILSELPEVKFVVAGDGAMLESWQALAGEKQVDKNFFFPGNVPFEMAPYYINSYDICVAPWDIELVGNVGLSPMKLYDYMACGKPIVSSRIYGVKEILEANNAGITVNVKNPKQFARVLIDLLNSPEKCKTISENALKTVRLNYTWEQTSGKIIDLVKSFE
ncbi:MAG: glycosyltransferase family 4 protein [Fidelibacterota bacterium]